MISSWKTQSHGTVRLRDIKEPITNLSDVIPLAFFPPRLLPFKMRNLKRSDGRVRTWLLAQLFFPLNHFKKNASKK